MSASKLFTISLLLVLPCVFGQSNYASHANNIEYVGGLPEEATLDGKVSFIISICIIIITKDWLTARQA